MQPVVIQHLLLNCAALSGTVTTNCGDRSATDDGRRAPDREQHWQAAGAAKAVAESLPRLLFLLGQCAVANQREDLTCHDKPILIFFDRLITPAPGAYWVSPGSAIVGTARRTRTPSLSADPSATQGATRTNTGAAYLSDCRLVLCWPRHPWRGLSGQGRASGD